MAIEVDTGWIEAIKSNKIKKLTELSVKQRSELLSAGVLAHISSFYCENVS
jgi:hypothetical protein